MGSSADKGTLSAAGRRVIVAGARDGLGRATVELLEQLGCSVAGCDVEDFDVRDRAAVGAGMASCVMGRTLAAEWMPRCHIPSRSGAPTRRADQG